jgi:hypothetical protein
VQGFCVLGHVGWMSMQLVFQKGDDETMEPTLEMARWWCAWSAMYYTRLFVPLLLLLVSICFDENANTYSNRHICHIDRHSARRAKPQQSNPI